MSAEESLTFFAIETALARSHLLPLSYGLESAVDLPIGNRPALGRLPLQRP